MNEIVEVWCSKCDQPTVAEYILTTGERKAYCKKHDMDLRYSASQARQAEMAKGAK